MVGLSLAWSLPLKLEPSFWAVKETYLFAQSLLAFIATRDSVTEPNADFFIRQVSAVLEIVQSPILLSVICSV